MPNNNNDRRGEQKKPFRKDGSAPRKPGQGKPQGGKPAQGSKPAFNKPKGASPARIAALEALMDVQIAEAYAGLALTNRIAAARLNALDRRLMTELFYGVLENRIHLDFILSKYMERPCEDDVTLQILRMVLRMQNRYLHI